MPQADAQLGVARCECRDASRRSRTHQGGEGVSQADALLLGTRVECGPQALFEFIEPLRTLLQPHAWMRALQTVAQIRQQLAGVAQLASPALDQPLAAAPQGCGQVLAVREPP